jgi:transposase
MANVLSPEQQVQVRALGRLGWSLRRIQSETGVHRETVRNYLQAAGIRIRGERRRRLDAAATGANPTSQVTTDPGAPNPASQVFPDSGAPVTEVLASAAKSSCEPHRDVIAGALDRGRNAKAIWQDLVDDHGFTASYESVKRFVRALQPSTLVAHPRITTAPGEEGQVDYGTGPMVKHPKTGKYRRTRLFVLTLGCSRKAVWLLRWESSSQAWCELHEEAFRRLGGAPRAIVLDNLREGVIDSDVYDPTINPLYHDMLAHYGVVALPARVGHPDRKGKVESSVGFAQKTPLAGMRFESLEEAQRYLDRWTDRWADTRIHGTRKRQVAEMFAEERPTLLPLPAEPFRYYQHCKRVVHLDGCIEVARAYYAAPPGWISREVHVRWDSRCVRIIDPETGQLLREHLRTQAGFFRVDPRDRSPRTPPQIDQLVQRGRVAGKHVGDLCERIAQRRHQFAAREILGVLSLVKRQGIAWIEDCCRTALERGVDNYRVVARLAKRPHEADALLQRADDLIRDLNHYRDVVRRRTETQDHEPNRTRTLPPQAPPVRDGRDSANQDRAGAGGEPLTA